MAVQAAQAKTARMAVTSTPSASSTRSPSCRTTSSPPRPRYAAPASTVNGANSIHSWAMAKTRDDAWAVLTEFTKNPSLIKHGLGVEAAMRAYAPRYSGDQGTWGIAGLLHDYDFERYPDASEHAMKGAAIMKERGWTATLCYATHSHTDHYRAHHYT